MWPRKAGYEKSPKTIASNFHNFVCMFFSTTFTACAFVGYWERGRGRGGSQGGKVLFGWMDGWQFLCTDSTWKASLSIALSVLSPPLSVCTAISLQENLCADAAAAGSGCGELCCYAAAVWKNGNFPGPTFCWRRCCCAAPAMSLLCRLGLQIFLLGCALFHCCCCFCF